MLLGENVGGDMDDSTDEEVEFDDALVCILELFDMVELLEDSDLGTVRDPVRVLELLLAEFEARVVVKRLDEVRDTVLLLVDTNNKVVFVERLEDGRVERLLLDESDCDDEDSLVEDRLALVVVCVDSELLPVDEDPVVDTDGLDDVI